MLQFIVVATIDFTDNDQILDLPPPMSRSEVENMTMAQKKMAAMIMEGKDAATAAVESGAVSREAEEAEMDMSGDEADQLTKRVLDASKAPQEAKVAPSNIKVGLHQRKELLYFTDVQFFRSAKTMSRNHNEPRRSLHRHVGFVDKRFPKQRWQSMSGSNCWIRVGRRSRWLRMHDGVLRTLSLQARMSLLRSKVSQASVPTSSLPRKKTKTGARGKKRKNVFEKERERRSSGTVIQLLRSLLQKDSSPEQTWTRRSRLCIELKVLRAKNRISDRDPPLQTQRKWLLQRLVSYRRQELSQALHCLLRQIPRHKLSLQCQRRNK